MEEVVKKTRIQYIDIAKALGMFAVIWGHIMQAEGWSNYLVYSFHIPIFFFLAGMVFNAKKYNSLRELIVKRFKTLIIPYFIFSIISWLIWVAYSLVTHAQVGNLFTPFLQTFIAQGSGGFFVYNVALWFIPCLLFTEIVYYFISKAKDWVNIIICLLLAGLGYFFMNFREPINFTLLPWSIEVSCAMMIFYSLGNLLVKKMTLEGVYNKVMKSSAAAIFIAIILTVLLLIGSNMNKHVSVAHCDLGNSTIVFYIVAFIGTFSTILVAMILSKLMPDKFKIKKFLLWVGKNSLYFLMIHNPVKGFICTIINKLYGVKETVFVTALISFVITMLITCVLVLITDKIAKWLKTKIKFLNA